MTCCQEPSFKLVEELGHAESVDWDLGQCAACGSFLLRQWSEYAPTKTFYDKLTNEEAQKFRSSSGRERKSLLKAWFNDH